MMKKLALAAVASVVLALASPAEAAMPSTAIGAHSTDFATPAKAKKVIVIKKKVCRPVYKWRLVWWKGHLTYLKVKVGRDCHWKTVRFVKPYYKMKPHCKMRAY